MTLSTSQLSAFDLELPASAQSTRSVSEPVASYLVPTGPFADGKMQTVEVEGPFSQQAWRIESQGLTTSQIMQPLREQLTGAGYDVLFDCAAKACGGFDFRFNTQIFAAPDMFVDLFDFRFLSARNANDEFVTLLISRVAARGYIQIIHARPAHLDVESPTFSLASGETEGLDQSNGFSQLGQTLETQGSAVLSDLEFATGSVDLGAGGFASLEALANYLKSDTSRRVALVGHTDAVGTLDNNVSLSRLRATSVMERLISDYGVASEQLEAGGMAYFAPRASNLSVAGREMNRRVEAVLLNTE